VAEFFERSELLQRDEAFPVTLTDVAGLYKFANPVDP
jgi:hypothetical protein